MWPNLTAGRLPFSRRPALGRETDRRDLMGERDAGHYSAPVPSPVTHPPTTTETR